MNRYIWILSIDGSQQERQSDIMRFLRREHTTIYKLPKKIYSDQTSAFSNQFAGNEECREHVNSIVSV